MKAQMEYLDQYFPDSFVCGRSKKAKPISPPNSRMNPFILMANSITGGSEKDNDLFLEIDHYFMAAFPQFWLKTIKFKKPAAHLQIFRGTDFGKHRLRCLRKTMDNFQLD